MKGQASIPERATTYVSFLPPVPDRFFVSARSQVERPKGAAGLSKTGVDISNQAWGVSKLLCLRFLCYPV